MVGQGGYNLEPTTICIVLEFRLPFTYVHRGGEKRKERDGHTGKGTVTHTNGPGINNREPGISFSGRLLKNSTLIFPSSYCH